MSRSARFGTRWSVVAPVLLGAVAIAVLVAVICFWAMRAPIAGAVIAPGIVRVESSRQVVQHLQGGVVRAILANDGDTVAQGDVLLQLDDSQLQSQLAVVQEQLLEILAQKLRLEAERDGLPDLVVPDDFNKGAGSERRTLDAINSQREFLAARIEARRLLDAQITQRISQTHSQIKGANAQLTALQSQLRLIRPELSDSLALLTKGLVPAARISTLRREQARLIGEIGGLHAVLAQLHSQVGALKTERAANNARIREQAIAGLHDLRIRKVELAQRRLALRESISNTLIRAPAGGVVHGTTVFALRSVIRGAEPILYIIAQDQPMLVVARIAALDVDQIRIGQDAILRFDVFDAVETPEISGQVVNISADAFVDRSTGQSYYKADLRPRLGDLSKLNGHRILPGMPADVFISTIKRTPFEYLAKPLASYFSKALREG